ncbi:MAG: tetratricopeptide repeat protein [Paludibacteraceae bacterium]|nr:tetratricopeptide repeat protein [Paludibacteraceae bacterium]
MRQYLENIANEIYRLADTKLFALAFVRLRVLLKELHEWWAIQRCEELETLCRQMLRYSLGDYEDPERGKIVAQLHMGICELVDDIVEAIELQNMHIVRPDVQFMGLKSELLYTSQVFDEKRAKEHIEVFRNVWLKGRLTADERRELITFIENGEIELTMRVMVVSALMLKGLRMYDKLVLMIYIALWDTVEAQIKARVIVGMLMILSVYASRVERDVELKDKIERLFADEKFSVNADKAYKYIINTFGTDKVTKKITTEIYPEIFKSGAKLHQMLKEEGGDAMNDDEFNPKWEKALMDDEGVSAKLREFGDMQMQGADVYMSTFSSMKGYAFFNELAHWFMPFDVKQGDVARMMADMPDVLRFFAESTHICNSDKYSFFYSIAQIPAANFKSMMTGMGADAEAVREDLDSESWKNNPEKLYAVEVRNYVLDLFRFYRLYPRRKEFVNPFDFIDKFESDGWLFGLMGLDLKKSVCKYLFEVEKFAEARCFFEYLDAQQVWDAYFYQQMGYCYQQLGEWNDAVGCYEKADLLESNDVWTLKRKALCYRRLERWNEAIECYEAILKLKEEDVATMLNLANMYVSIDDFEKARMLLYKVDYLRPNNYKAMSGLAWCLFVGGDYEKAMTYYDKLSQHKDFSAEDALNGGHTFWALGAKDIAREYYRKAKALIDNDVKFAEKMIEDAEYLKRLGLSDEDIVILINQILF